LAIAHNPTFCHCFYATNTNANLFNGIIGVVMGVFSALIGIYLMVVCAKQKIEQ